MEKPWKEIQDLVAYFERELAGQGIIIKSPDWIWDKFAQTKREVDISLRKQEDFDEVLIIFEVRDWKAVQDITWIEQLVTKKKHLSANHLIAVTTSDFSKSARNVAEKYDIELRLISEVTAKDIGLWFTLSEMKVRKPDIKILNIEFGVHSFIDKKNFIPYEGIIVREKWSGIVLSEIQLNRLIHSHPEFQATIKKIFPTAPKTNIEQTIFVSDKIRAKYELLINGKFVDLHFLKLLFDVLVDEIKIPVKLKRKYTRRTKDAKDGEIFAQISEFEGLFLGNPILIRAFNYPVIKKSNIVVFYDNPDFEISDATLDIEYHDESKIPKTMQFTPENLNK